MVSLTSVNTTNSGYLAEFGASIYVESTCSSVERERWSKPANTTDKEDTATRPVYV